MRNKKAQFADPQTHAANLYEEQKAEIRITFIGEQKFL